VPLNRAPSTSVEVEFLRAKHLLVVARLLRSDLGRKVVGVMGEDLILGLELGTGNVKDHQSYPTKN
jgi:hypothetical protein